jgi:hypothetical protein
MRGSVTVHEAGGFERWQAEKAAGAAARAAPADTTPGDPQPASESEESA